MDFQGRPVLITVHAVKRAREREIAYPDQVLDVLRTGKVTRFGKNGLKFVKKGKHGSIICLGEDLGHAIVIKTVERGELI
ncbi:DUF4258 domain-containing protein [Candidatus Woesearchaeota archaeon]|nr:DUF4258 domain-containing protein [Candidatus Woesearchaeota archaeon]